MVLSHHLVIYLANHYFFVNHQYLIFQEIDDFGVVRTKQAKETTKTFGKYMSISKGCISPSMTKVREATPSGIKLLCMS